ncbi:hypothetical protein FRB90_001542 [Tulasnella sp. 427]|nr:hypothetical protein FRB90_001542 [Tulasnella sp. 427]
MALRLARHAQDDLPQRLSSAISSQVNGPMNASLDLHQQPLQSPMLPLLVGEDDVDVEMDGWPLTDCIEMDVEEDGYPPGVPNTVTPEPGSSSFNVTQVEVGPSSEHPAPSVASTPPSLASRSERDTDMGGRVSSQSSKEPAQPPPRTNHSLR